MYVRAGAYVSRLGVRQTGANTNRHSQGHVSVCRRKPVATQSNLLYNITAQATVATTSLSSPVYVLTHAPQHERSEMPEADDIHTPDRACPTILIKQRAPDLTRAACDWSSSFSFSLCTCARS